MHYSRSLLEGYLPPQETLLWWVEGCFSSRQALSGKRRRRWGCLLATPQRLVFVRHGRHHSEIESLPYRYLGLLSYRKTCWGQSLRFTSSGNPCHLACWRHPELKHHFYSLRQQIAFNP